MGLVGGYGDLIPPMRTRRAATGLLLFLQLGCGEGSFVRTIEFTIFVAFDLRKARKRSVQQDAFDKE